MNDLAKRIPFTFLLHLNGEKKHSVLHENQRLNLRVEKHTKYRNGEPGKVKSYCYVNTKGSKAYETLIELLEANPDLAALAEQAYGGINELATD
jgi:hypothetical protein